MAASRNKPSSNLPASLAAFLAARVPPTLTLCVGLSGGRDSVVLLHALISAGFLPRLSALHVNHGLSPQADAWEAHCRQLCEEWGLPFNTARVEIDATTGLGLEAAARHARYACFADVAADCILLAHHQDDQAETMLFNLLRGSGVAGAKGMPAERKVGKKHLLRPLLAVPAADVLAYAQAEGLSWIEDESNANVAFSRNYLRHQVMPILQARFPQAATQLARAAGHFAEAECLLGELAAYDWLVCAAGEEAVLAVLRQLSASRLRNLLRWRLHELGWRTPDATRLDEFVRQLMTAGPEGRPCLRLPDGEMRVRRGRLAFVSPA